MKREILKPKNVSLPVAPYSQGAKVGNFVFTAGTGPFDTETNTLVEGGIKVQTRQVLENLKAILEAGGSNLENIVQVTIWITSFDNYKGMNEAYAEYFPSDPPPRATVQVAGLWGGMLVEMMAIAVCSE